MPEIVLFKYICTVSELPDGKRKMAETGNEVVFPPSANLRSNSSAFSLHEYWRGFDGTLSFLKIGIDSTIFGDDLEYGDANDLRKKWWILVEKMLKVSSSSEKKIGGFEDGCDESMSGGAFE